MLGKILNLLSGQAPEPEDAEGQYKLACRYYADRKTRQKSIEWYRKAAEQGHIAAQSFLGSCYLIGDNVTQDYQQAVYWYRKAAEQGDVTAQALLASCYKNGNGVQQDYLQAIEWYRKAAKQGDAGAEDELQSLLSKVSPPSQNRPTPLVVKLQVPCIYASICVKGEKVSLAVDKIIISGNDIFIDEYSTKRVSIDVSTRKFKAAFRKEDIANFETYKEPDGRLFDNFSKAMIGYWSVLKGYESDLQYIYGYVDKINIYLERFGIESFIDEDGWVFYQDDALITLESVLRLVYADRLVPVDEEDEEDETISSTQPQSQPKPSTPTPTPKAPPEPPKAPSKPNLSIEEQLVNYLKKQPVQWDYPLRSNNEALKTICNIAVRSNGATATITDEVLENLELSIQKKRARNPQLADHNAAMEGNILAMLYEYSYLMQMFHAIYTLDFDTTQVDIQKLWSLIQTDCNARIDNLAAEKRKNPAIQATLDKYRYDNQITKLRVLNDATGREMDYIISFIMDYALLSVMNFLLGNTKLLLTLRAFPIDDVIAMMDSFITTDATIRFTAYSR